MMYKNKLVASIKVDGKILREFNELVRLPFGTEYSILIKNLNTVRALVSVYIDETDVGGNSQFIINPGQDLELKRFVTSDLTKGNAFRFIERTSKIESHRGISQCDGLVRVVYRFERKIDLDDYFKKKYDELVCPSPSPWPNSWPRPLWDNYHTGIGDNLWGQVGHEMYCLKASSTSLGSVDISARRLSLDKVNPVSSNNDIGITVPGKEVTQEFKEASGFLTENEQYVIIIRLAGEVSKPITVNTKIQCPTCGQHNHPTDNFCSGCGTAVKIY